MKRELISVIVPVHNGQDYLQNCIDSIAGQTYEELEILVVNDGSTDRTAAVCGQLQETCGKVRVFTLPDVGVSAARNYALDQAKGAYVAFVDADDRLCPDTLRYLYDRITATDSDLAGCRFAVWRTEDDWTKILAAGETEQKEEETLYNNISYLKNSILSDNCRCWSKLYRRSAVGKVRFRENLTVGEDMLFLVDLLPGLRRAVETSYRGYGYYQNPGGVMQRSFTPSYMDQIKSWELAQEAVLRMDESLRGRTAAKIMTAIMLTVGKIALCPFGERRKFRKYLARCREKLQKQLRVRGSAGYLPPGYGIKVKLFHRLPGLYVRLYHGLQTVKNIRRGGR